MERYNLVIVVDGGFRNVLMCKRAKNQYVGLYNFIGGHIEEGETDIDSAYRELLEETGINSNNLELKFLMKLYYAMSDIELVIYTGQLLCCISLIEEENTLHWVPINTNFFLDCFAGDGNVGHMMAQIMINRDKLFCS